MPADSGSDILALALARPTVLRSLKVALVVGTLLALINYADRWLEGSMARSDYIKLGLTYLVPYAVATWSAVGALRQR